MPTEFAQICRYGVVNWMVVIGKKAKCSVAIHTDTEKLATHSQVFSVVVDRYGLSIADSEDNI